MNSEAFSEMLIISILGSRHGMQDFQHVCDAVIYVLPHCGQRVSNDIDDFFGIGMSCDTYIAFDSLYSALQQLGLTIRFL